MKKKQLKKSETSPDLSYEYQSGHPNRLVAGVDEVGRGCLAGDVVAAAVVLPSTLTELETLFKKEPLFRFVTDSKKLNATKRKQLEPIIKELALGYSIQSASVEEIDRLNILYASHLAMERCIIDLDLKLGKISEVLVDGNFVPKRLKPRGNAIIKGDQKVFSVACASILAKVYRDEWMTKLDLEYPEYELKKHKGYSTALHKKLLKKHGVSVIHRKSFAPVRELL